MKEVLILLFVILFGLIPLTAQDDQFAERAAEIAENIDSITIAEKAKMKLEIKEIDEQLRKGEITTQEAREQRIEVADIYALKIERKINNEKLKLNQLVSNRVDDKVAEIPTDTYPYKEDDNKKKEKISGEKRTTSQFVFAFGLNTLSGKNGAFPAELKVWPSKFWEFGLTRNTRLSNNSNLLHLKYGLSLVYNNLKPEDNKVFTAVDNQTILVQSDINFKRNRFRNFYLNLPIHMEFDLSPMEYSEDGTAHYKSHKDFRIGFGGYIGILINSKNFFKFDDDGHEVKFSVKDNYNVNDFNYGLSGYIGYRQFSLYTKYDLQPLFENNPTDEHNFSIGVRWDFN